MALKDLISINDLSSTEIRKIFTTAAGLKANPLDYSEAMAGCSVALIFEKPSLRTRVTFDLGATQMGASCVYLDHQSVRLGERESVKDMALNLERWVDVIVVRTYSHETVIELAAHSSAPVINGLSEFSHPCQGLTDYFTLTEKVGLDLKGFRIAYVGDGNNTCHSLLYTSAKLGAHMTVVTPEGFEPNSRVVNEAMHFAQSTGSKIAITNDIEATKGAQVVYTDVWASMGQEAETEERAAIFADYRVDDEVMEKAGPEAVFMHCLPAHRGAEVSASVIDSQRSIVYDQAENRLHVQNAILLLLVGKIGK